LFCFYKRNLKIDENLVESLKFLKLVISKRIVQFAKGESILNYWKLLDLLKPTEVGQLVLEGIINPFEFTKWFEKHPTMFPANLEWCMTLVVTKPELLQNIKLERSAHYWIPKEPKTTNTAKLSTQ